MRDMVSKITDEVGKLLDLQTQLLKKRTFLDLSPCEVDDYQLRREAFEVSPLDYLVKPITAQRLAASLQPRQDNLSPLR